MTCKHNQDSINELNDFIDSCNNYKSTASSMLAYCNGISGYFSSLYVLVEGYYHVGAWNSNDFKQGSEAFANASASLSAFISGANTAIADANTKKLTYVGKDCDYCVAVAAAAAAAAAASTNGSNTTVSPRTNK